MQVKGYAYAAPFRERIGYRFTIENSVYTCHKSKGLGLGKLLMTELIAQCTKLGKRTMIAGIAEPDVNTASVGLHKRMGFTDCGLMKDCGVKFGVTLSVGFYQLQLNPKPADEPNFPVP